MRFYVLALILILGCDNSKIVRVEIPDNASDSEAFKQISGGSYPDFITSSDIRDDIVYSFTTHRDFYFEGKRTIPVFAFRGVVIWHGNRENRVGIGDGVIVEAGTENEVSELVPGKEYSYIAEYKGEFSVLNAFYSNFYYRKGGEININSSVLRKGISLEKTIKENQL